MKFVIDEDVHRSLGVMLKKQGYIVKDIRDYNLRGKEDEKIYEFAQKVKAVIITKNRGFGNIIPFPLGKHFGIIIIHLPSVKCLQKK